MSAITRLTAHDSAAMNTVPVTQGFAQSHIRLLSRSLPPGWSVERHEGYDFAEMILLMPPQGRGSIYVIDRTAEGFNLSANASDDFQHIREFLFFSDLLVVVNATINAER